MLGKTILVLVPPPPKSFFGLIAKKFYDDPCSHFKLIVSVVFNHTKSIFMEK